MHWNPCTIRNGNHLLIQPQILTNKHGGMFVNCCSRSTLTFCEFTGSTVLVEPKTAQGCIKMDIHTKRSIHRNSTASVYIKWIKCSCYFSSQACWIKCSCYFGSQAGGWWLGSPAWSRTGKYLFHELPLAFPKVNRIWIIQLVPCLQLPECNGLWRTEERKHQILFLNSNGVRGGSVFGEAGDVLAGYSTQASKVVGTKCIMVVDG